MYIYAISGICILTNYNIVQRFKKILCYNVFNVLCKKLITHRRIGPEIVLLAFQFKMYDVQ